MRRIQVLGPGCAKCELLALHAAEAVRQAGLTAEVELVTDIEPILRYDVLVTPALVIDGQVRAVGKLLSPAEIQALLVSD